MKILVSLFAMGFILLGLLFLVAAFHPQANTMGRLIIGGVLLAAGGLMMYLAQMRPTVEQITVQHTLDAPGELKIKEMKCRQCGGALSRDNMKISEAGVTVACPYCGSTYQIEEAPKW
jgi:DNA-directed RNA polymerase subunit RPC12/RpoP